MKTLNKNNSSIPTFLFLLVISSLTIFSCDPDDEPVPQEPRFPYFLMDIDGEPWYPYGATPSGFPPFDVIYNPETDGFISFSAVSTKDDISNISFSSRHIELGQKHEISLNILMRDRGNMEGCIKYYPDTLSSNWIFISEWNEPDRKIKGTFEFNVLNECSDSHQVTNGRFYMNYD